MTTPVLYCAASVLAACRFYIMWRRPRWRRDGFHVVEVRREKYTIEHANIAGFFEALPLEKVPLTHLKLVVVTLWTTRVTFHFAFKRSWSLCRILT